MNCDIRDFAGSGLLVSNDASIEAHSNLIAGCENGVTIQSGAKAAMYNATIAGCGNAGAILHKDGESVTQGQFQNCILWNNRMDIDADAGTTFTLSFSDFQSAIIGPGSFQNSGDGNISLDPLFMNPEGGDYSLGEGSPCIDAGNPDPLWSDACLPPGRNTARCDMGGYGGPYNCGWTQVNDYNIVDHILGRNPLRGARLILADRNKDGLVNVADIVILMRETGYNPQPD